MLIIRKNKYCLASFTYYPKYCSNLCYSLAQLAHFSPLPAGKEWGTLGSYCLFFLLLLKDNCFIEFCCFLSNLKINQP